MPVEITKSRMGLIPYLKPDYQLACLDIIERLEVFLQGLESQGVQKASITIGHWITGLYIDWSAVAPEDYFLTNSHNPSMNSSEYIERFEEEDKELGITMTGKIWGLVSQESKDILIALGKIKTGVSEAQTYDYISCEV